MSTPREIAFEDIRKGDDIEARWTLDGLRFTRRGVAHHRNPLCWYTEEGGRLANSDGDWTHYLHSRPAPAEPKGLGAIVRAVVGGNEWYFHRIGTGERPWINVARNWHAWYDFDPDSIEVLSEGNEVEP